MRDVMAGEEDDEGGDKGAGKEEEKDKGRCHVVNAHLCIGGYKYESRSTAYMDDLFFSSLYTASDTKRDGAPRSHISFL